MQGSPLDASEAEIVAFLSSQFQQRISVVNFEGIKHDSAILTRFGLTASRQQLELPEPWALLHNLQVANRDAEESKKNA